MDCRGRCGRTTGPLGRGVGRAAADPHNIYLSVGTEGDAAAASWAPHDAGLWLAAFHEAGDGTDHPDMDRLRGLRRLIWLQTEAVVRSAARWPGQWPGLSAQPPATFRFCGEGGPGSGARPGGPPWTDVLGQDFLDVAGAFADQGHSVAVLNMASPRRPGGGTCGGAGAQEENLHRRTDACRFTMGQAGNYPIPAKGCLVSPGVTAFRGNEQRGYPWLAHPFTFTMISCAAVNRPALTAAGHYARPRERALMRHKISTLVEAAERAGCSAAVFSALGCGAYRNPPDEVAALFREALRHSSLAEVAFCILEDHNGGRWHNPAGNLLPFQLAFG